MSEVEAPERSAGSYQEAFDRFGIPEELRKPEHYFFDQTSDGSIFPVPREINMDKGVYELSPNGSVVELSAQVDPSARLGARAVVYANVVIGDAEIEDGAVIGAGSAIGDGVRIRVGAKLGSPVFVYDRTTVGSYVSIGERSSIGRGVEIGALAKIGRNVHIEKGVIVGAEVQIEDGASVGQQAKIGEGSRLLDGTRVRVGKRIRPQTLVYSPYRYRKAKKCI